MVRSTKPSRRVTPFVSLPVLVCVANSLLADPPDRLNVGGLGDFIITTIETDDPRYLSEVAPCGDVDGDGLDDVLMRVHLAGSAAGEDDAVVLLYGEKAPSTTIDPVRDDVRKTMIRTGRVRDRGPQIAGGEDLDGDGRPDFVVASSFEESIGGPAHLVILGGAGLPEEIEIHQIAAEIRGTVIFDSNPKDPATVASGGQLVALSPDINGDGHAEVLVAETARINDRKRSFVLFGTEDFPARIDLAGVGGEVPGFTVFSPDDLGPVGLRWLGGLTSLGDINGDGLADLGFVVPNNWNNPEEGFFDESFILFGRMDFPGTVHLDSDLGGGRGIRFPRYEQIARGGDVDGDGLQDPILFHMIGPLEVWPRFHPLQRSPRELPRGYRQRDVPLESARHVRRRAEVSLRL